MLGRHWTGYCCPGGCPLTSALAWWAYPVIGLATLTLTLVLVPGALWAARRWDFLDRPSDIKAHSSPIPYLGGAAILVAFTAVVLGAALLRPADSSLHQLEILLGMAMVLSLMGLFDDLRGLSPWIRLAVEVAAGIGVWASGSSVALSFLPGPVNVVITVMWVVGVTNAFNLLDNMDGLSAGVAAIASLSFFALSLVYGQFLLATLSIALAGCAAGFLRHNFHPARIYMGDAGSLFLGFLLSVIALRLRILPGNQVSFLVPVVVLGVALFDTALVTVNRLVSRRGVLSGGVDHTSHRLVFIGIPVPVAVALIYAAGGTLGWIGIILSRIDSMTSVLLAALVFGIALFLGVLLSLVPVYEQSRRHRLVITEVARRDPEADLPSAPLVKIPTA
ncbi:MAG: undecaprenyl/decaprenyl-phosphate alpha-N-acetylglucosaminyl 1-phosphate transferase [Acidimicrobiales bacterium]|nr:MAG: undecaprenyl/decaprenyl-phosphate alpha-N-acetylglucosaminyl 1-phosphate transferase [Acidimicrobiales bacterium]